MRIHFAVSAFVLVLCTVDAVRMSETNSDEETLGDPKVSRKPIPAGLPPAQNGFEGLPLHLLPKPKPKPPPPVHPLASRPKPPPTAEDWGSQDLHPETDPRILQRIANVKFERTPTGAGLPALVPRMSEGVCGYYFAIKELARGAQMWYMTGMRVTRTGDMGDCEDVKTKRIPLAQLEWEDKVKQKFFTVRSAKSKNVIMIIRQEAKGKYMFRILPPDSDDAADSRYVFENDDHALYSGSRATEHHWAVYSGDQKEEKVANMECHFRLCGIEKTDENESRIGGTEQTKPDDPDAVVMKREDVINLDVDVDVSFGQDSGLILALASTMTHKYRPKRTGISGAVMDTVFGDATIH